MNRAERQTAILALLSESASINVETIVSRLDVSPATARRDLDYLAQQQLLTRTHGGALAHSIAYDLPIRYKRENTSDTKSAIARAASALVPVGSVVGLSGGTTAAAIAGELMSRPDVMDSGDGGLTIVTNAVNIAMQLALRPQIKTIVTGGVVHARTYELVGGFADGTLAGLTLDIAFISCFGLDAEFGATVMDEREAVVNAHMARRANQPVLVADSSKLGRRALATVGDSRLFPSVLMDGGADADRLAELTGAGYSVQLAS